MFISKNKDHTNACMYVCVLNDTNDEYYIRPDVVSFDKIQIEHDEKKKKK